MFNEKIDIPCQKNKYFSKIDIIYIKQILNRYSVFWVGSLPQKIDTAAAKNRYCTKFKWFGKQKM